MKVMILRTDDWEVLIVDGEVKAQNHSLDLIEVLKELDVDHEFHYYDDDDGFDEWMEQFLKCC